MRLISFIVTVFLTISTQLFSQSYNPVSELYFEKNIGQLVDQNGLPNNDVLYVLRNGTSSILIRKDGYSIQDIRVSTLETPTVNGIFEESISQRNSPVEIQRVDVRFNEMSTRASVIAFGENEGINTYISKFNPQLNYKPTAAKRIRINKVYNKIDIEYYIDEQSGEFKYDIILLPGARAADLKISYGSHYPIQYSPQSLKYRLLDREIEDVIPATYFLRSRTPLTANYLRISDTEFSFSIVGVGRVSDTLVIDPYPKRVWTRVRNGNGFDNAQGLTTDASQNVIYVSRSFCTNLATTGSYQVFNGGGMDASISKMTSTGILQWSTFYGGTGTEWPKGIEVDANNDIYVAGLTYSSTGISSSNTYNGGGDGFLAKFSASGDFRWARYIGGSSWEDAGITSISSNKILVVGKTLSETGIATPGAHQTALNLGISQTNRDAYLQLYDSIGNRSWGTYLGGAEDELSSNTTCFDGAGNLYFVAYTKSSNLAINSLYDSSYAGETDVLLTKFSPTGTVLWSNYVGGEKIDYVTSGGGYNWSYLSVVQDTLYLGISTKSKSGITGLNPSTETGDNYDGAIIAFALDGSFRWGKYIAGNAYDYLGFTTIDGKLISYINTNSTNLPVSTNALQNSIAGGYDNYFQKMNLRGNLEYATYFGDATDESELTCRFFNVNTFYSFNCFTSNNISYSQRISRYAFCEINNYNPFTADTLSLCGADSIVLNAGSGYVSYNWNSGQLSDTIIVRSGNSGWYIVSVTDAQGCVGLDSVYVLIDPTTIANFTFSPSNA
ncbi:MAG: hypothetical protein FJY17_01245, partial [Bacteroidetes bacterium]|nr:hypothetical protein [Bacteroidota bacterium]